MGKEANNTIHEFHLTIYPRRLWVVKDADIDYIKTHFCYRDYKELDFGNDVSSYKAIVFEVINIDTEKYGNLVCIFDNLNVEDIAHEALHVTFDIAFDMGLYPLPNNQEPMAYLIGFVADCINQVVTGEYKE